MYSQRSWGRDLFLRPLRWLLLSLLLLGALHCGAPGRDNPFDPQGSTGPDAVLALRIPLPKALVTIVDRVEATLEGPGMLPVVKVLSHGPTGPAVGTIGAIPPGTDRVLTVLGFALDGRLLLQGQTRGIVIRDGDTTRVGLDLFVVPDDSDAGAAGGVTDAGGTDSGASDGGEGGGDPAAGEDGGAASGGVADGTGNGTDGGTAGAAGEEDTGGGTDDGTAGAAGGADGTGSGIDGGTTGEAGGDGGAASGAEDAAAGAEADPAAGDAADAGTNTDGAAEDEVAAVEPS